MRFWRGCAGRTLKRTLLKVVFVVGDLFENGDFVGDAKALRANAGKNGAANFAGQRFGSEHARFFTREMLHKLSGDVGGGEGYRRSEESVLANGIERRKQDVGANGEMNVFFVAAFDAADDNSGGEASILQDSLAN